PRMDLEVDSIREALRHAARDDVPTRELAIATGTWRYWWIRGYLAEGRATSGDILARRGIVPTANGIRMARAAAALAWSMGDFDEASRLATEALASAKAVGEVTEELSAHNVLGVIHRSQGRLDDAEAQFSEALRMAEAQGNAELV